MAAVLIVDDDDDVRDVLYDLFSTEHLCHLAATAEEALKFLEAEPYDVAIVDISLPGMSGLELMGHILQRWPDTPVILVTGIGYQHQYAQSLIMMGAFDYLEKPFHVRDAEGKVGMAISLRERWLADVKERAGQAIKYGKRLKQERRGAVRHTTQRAARLQFASGPSAAKSAAEAPQPTLISHTRDISETGLALIVPCVRSTDGDFYGAEGRLLITLSLPTGIVELQAIAARYEWLDQNAPGKGYIIGVRIIAMSKDDRARLSGFLAATP